MELCFEGSFGTACLNGMDIRDASVVCRALNFSGGQCSHSYKLRSRLYMISSITAGIPVNALREFNVFGSGAVLVTEVLCQGDEAHPFQCDTDNNNDDCSHTSDAGVMCLGKYLTAFGKVVDKLHIMLALFWRVRNGISKSSV